ncbi:MAG: hypothetical protein KY439_08210 [Actinobacteria bacterium]|nr:hypothetical protein [Actinomycetota bacterium]
MFQWTIELHHQWKSMPSCPTLVVASTQGQNGLLKAARISGSRAASSLWRPVPYRSANRLVNGIRRLGW